MSGDETDVIPPSGKEPSSVVDHVPQPTTVDSALADSGNSEPTRKPDDPGTEPDAPAKPATQLCDVCRANPAKYKCPRCRLPYCSVACNKTHRENHPPDPQPPPATANPGTTPTSETPKAGSKRARDPSSIFSVLDGSEQLQRLFEKYPNLPDKLLEIHAASQPPNQKPTGAIPMTETRRLEQHMWNRALGERKGKEALRRAKALDSEDGEAVREYSELVLHLLSKNGQETTNPAAALRRQVANEDEKLLRQLVEAEEKRQKK